ncbi:Kelch-like protein diablo [Diplonema papillatum]|nr:Kelch-like protein diablo [Diplonema papillatum]
MPTIKLCVGEDVHQREVGSWDDVVKVVGGLVKGEWSLSWYDEGGESRVRSAQEWQRYAAGYGAGRALHVQPAAAAQQQQQPQDIRHRDPVSWPFAKKEKKHSIEVDARVLASFQQLQTRLHMDSNQTLRFLMRRLSPDRSSRLHDVPESVLINALLYLPSGELRYMAGVCSKWMRVVKNNPLIQQHLDIHGLYVIGGMNHSGNEPSILRTVVRCNPVHETWTNASSMNDERYHCGTAIYDRQVYVFGGRNLYRRLSSSECYDPLTNTWKVLPPMSTVRSAPACAVHRGNIFVFGGFDGTKEYRKVERFNPVKNVWANSNTIATMPFEACEHGAISLGPHIYIIGGTQRRHSPGEKVLHTVQRFDPEKNEWTALPPMGTKRMCPAAVAYEGKIWVIGGSDGENALDSVECYNPESQVWTEGPSMGIARSNASASVVGKKIYVIGGFCANEGGPLSCVDRYDPNTGWTTMSWGLPEKRDACKVLTWE